jgi:hypothetical protein
MFEPNCDFNRDERVRYDINRRVRVELRASTVMSGNIFASGARAADALTPAINPVSAVKTLKNNIEAECRCTA